jgi:gamma-glutamylcyclotransferase (GGCT)/AIG2-like uncharacterized protein YtfP
MALYFAYGSNMDEIQMKESCPSAKLISNAILKNFKLSFTIFSPKRQCGCADVVSSKADEVFGLLYRLSKKDIEKLDEFENVPTAYKRTLKKVLDLSGVEHNAFVYEVVTKKHFIEPSIEYINLIKNSAIKNKFPRKYLQTLDRVPVIKTLSI